ncbi:hypothetical protein PRIPAC_90376, partial [Pristionchus pacificus]|uniref:Uncharacterized protein n=1 Tax=Pristionchus pacificus TaxID=54126 RepID=A0A2A6CWR4_PRIPA
TLPGLPLNGTIEIAAVLRAKAGGDKRKPMLVFQPVDGSSYFLKFYQEWTGETQRAFLGTNEALDNGHSKSTQCTRDWMKPNGDLVHFNLTRIRYNVVEVRVLYKYTVVNSYRTNSEVICWMWINKDLSAVMDRPFNIMSHDSALLLHVKRSYPDHFPPSSAAEVLFDVSTRCSCYNGECQVCEYHPVPSWNAYFEKFEEGLAGDNCDHRMDRIAFWGGC